MGKNMTLSAEKPARSILDAFDDYHERFRRITLRAEKRFREEDWTGFRNDAAERLDVYGQRVDQAVSETTGAIRDIDPPEPFWREIKARFADITEKRDDRLLAETFFNSVTRRVFAVVGVNPDIEFSVADFEVPAAADTICPECSAYVHGASGPDTLKMVRDILLAFHGRIPLYDMDADAGRMAVTIEAHLARLGLAGERMRVEMADPVFYRDKIAYLLGRMLIAGAVVPLVVCILHMDGRCFVDAVLMDEDDVSILFSFARSYFHVIIDYPEELAGFIKTIIPQKRLSEIYTSLGYHKHGKAELFRELTRSLEHSGDRFEIARGEAGMVMFVFTIPSFDVVFKIIRDAFDYPKHTTADAIKERYRLVFRHDRAGRLVDAQEFDHLEFDRALFPEAFLKELTRKAGKNIVVTRKNLVIRHLYTERRLTPLNLYIQENPPEAATRALIDYGWAVKELAASNIFPGDLFFKNFGVTRHGRVVFYDYDELKLLSECRFRKKPEARSMDEVMSDEPWFAVYENDVFPEEFKTFIHFPDYAKVPFESLHQDLFDVDFWQNMQKRVESETAVYILPYDSRRRISSGFLRASSDHFFFNRK